MNNSILQFLIICWFKKTLGYVNNLKEESADWTHKLNDLIQALQEHLIKGAIAML